MAKSRRKTNSIDRNALITSWSEEIRSRCDRVRSLIGDRHWLSDGRHKEVILAQILSRYIYGLRLESGFVISRDTKAISPELDIFLADFTTCPPVLNEGSTCIAFSESVAAAIEVKSTLSAQVLKDVVQHFEKVRHAMKPSPFGYWYGAYFFRSNLNAEQLGEQLRLALRECYSARAYLPAQKFCLATLDGLLAFVVPGQSPERAKIKMFAAGASSFPLAIADLVGFCSEWRAQSAKSPLSPFEDFLQGIELPPPSLIDI